MFRRLLYASMYLLGRPRWDTGQTPPEVIEAVEGGGLTPGRALDLGCGTGTNAVYLARRGWQVVGIDFIASAIRQGRRKARQAGLDGKVSLHRGDVTEMGRFVTGRVSFALDIGCLHSLALEDQRHYADALTRLVEPGGLYMLYGFLPGGFRGTDIGFDAAGVAALFAPGFRLARSELGSEGRSAWYWLERV